MLGLLCLCCFMTPDLLLYQSEFNFATSSWTTGAEWESGCRGFLETEICWSNCNELKLFSQNLFRNKEDSRFLNLKLCAIKTQLKSITSQITSRVLTPEGLKSSVSLINGLDYPQLHSWLPSFKLCDIKNSLNCRCTSPKKIFLFMLHRRLFSVRIFPVVNLNA